MVIAYADAAGQQRGAVRIDVYTHRDNIHGKWYVRQVAYAEDAEQVRRNPSVVSIPTE